MLKIPFQGNRYYPARGAGVLHSNAEKKLAERYDNDRVPLL